MGMLVSWLEAQLSASWCYMLGSSSGGLGESCWMEMMHAGKDGCVTTMHLESQSRPKQWAISGRELR